MAQAKQPVSIDGLEFDALISSDETYEATLPEYTIENGYTVTDSIILTADKLDMTLYVTNTPVTWAASHGIDETRVTNVVEQLKEIFKSRKLVTIITSDCMYENMAISSFTISESLETGYAREIPISFQQVNTTASETTTIPDSYAKSGATAQSAGTANTTSATTSSTASSSSSSSASSSSSSSSSSKSSILYSLASSAGLIN